MTMNTSMKTIQKSLSTVFSPGKKKSPVYKLVEERSPGSLSAKTASSAGESRAQFDEFLRRAKELGIRTKIEDGWEVVDKEDVEKDIEWEREEQDAEEWDFVEDEDEIRDDISIL
ncbi:hypothetical protein K505DRAFT_337056 [Melanomma pulvis-pyrius CBS 109.77]|uniref:Uncharacterized protein n=1 Tax=Melanomma pulvis-pyrius CBS 109.77 TaxID=1314802 RepID=A0A6A6XEZ9_9PLEO|nr:hypothetical protein K505DRAFT_337056 [Melanomma pulvis-pyrius CBS 109.77]